MQKKYKKRLDIKRSNKEPHSMNIVSGGHGHFQNGVFYFDGPKQCHEDMRRFRFHYRLYLWAWMLADEYTTSVIKILKRRCR